jgi:hypothetical protein
MFRLENIGAFIMRHITHAFRSAGAVLWLAATALPALASTTLPPLRPGFWQTTMLMHMNLSGQPPDTDNTPMVNYNCQDAASMAAAMKMMAGAIPGCTFDLEGGGNTYTITTSCKNIAGQPGTLTGTGTITLAGDAAMHMVETSSGNIGSMQMSSNMTGDSKWIGACPAGVQPGDFGKMVNGAFQKEGNTLAPPPAPPAQ